MDGRRQVEDRYRLNMDQSLQELQDKIQEYQHELSALQGQPPHPALSGSKTAPLEVMKTAFDEVSKSKPFVPTSGSVLPALIAMRKTHQTISESRAYLATRGASIDNTRRQLETEQAHLNDQQLLTKSLENRIRSLKSDLESRMEMTPEQVAKERLHELRQKKKHYDKETSKLLKAFNKFIDEHLAAQLAAEDLGGPVVGDMMEIDSDNLVAGFNAQGRPKKMKAKPDDDKRQRRLDDIWGRRQEQRGRGGSDWDETAAAGQEMRDLTEQLLNQLLEAGGDSTAAYVKLPKETAAARFLVRSKVAQFHAKDSSRIKLVDFGRELDD